MLHIALILKTNIEKYNYIVFCKIINICKLIFLLLNLEVVDKQ